MRFNQRIVGNRRASDQMNDIPLQVSSKYGVMAGGPVFMRPIPNQEAPFTLANAFHKISGGFGVSSIIAHTV